MPFLQILFFAFLLLASIYFTLLNQTVIPVHLTSSIEFDLPISILLLSTLLLGVVITFLLTFISNFRARVVLRKKYRQKEKLNQTYIKGLEYYISGQEKKSISLLKKILTNDSSKVVPLTLLGNIYRSQENYNKAIDYHQKAKFLAPKDKFVLKNLEEDYSFAKDITLQTEVVKELVQIENGNPDNLLRLRELHTQSENWDEAIVIQNQVISKAKDPDKLKEEKRKASIFYYESALEAFNKDLFGVAVQKLKSSIEVDSSFIPSHILFGESYLKLEKEKKALRAWEEGYQQTNDPLFLKRMDKFYIDRNRPKEVVQLYQNAIKKKPNYPLLHFLLGEAYIRFEMFDDALSEFKNAYAFYPDSIALSLLIGKIYEKKDDFQSASGEYQKAFKKELSSVLKFTCGKCGFQISKWVGRCPECKEWDIKSFDINKPNQKLLD